MTYSNYPFQPKLPVSFSGNFQWQMEQQTRLKKAKIILFSMSRSFRIIPAIPDNFGRFSNTTEYFRILLKIPKGCWILAKTTEYVRELPENSEEKSENFRPRNSVRCFLTTSTLDCFKRSKVILFLWLSKANPSLTAHIKCIYKSSEGNPVDPAMVARLRCPSPSSLTKWSRALDRRLVPGTPQVSLDNTAQGLQKERDYSTF